MTLTHPAVLDALRQSTANYMAAILRKLARYTGWTRLAALALLVALLALRVADPPPISGLRLAAFDVYQQLHPRPYMPAPVTVLDIDDASLEDLGQWPWPRTRIAELVDAATAAGSAAIAFDIVFAEPDRLSPARVAEDNPDLPAAAQFCNEFVCNLQRPQPVIGGPQQSRIVAVQGQQELFLGVDQFR